MQDAGKNETFSGDASFPLLTHSLRGEKQKQVSQSVIAFLRKLLEDGES